MLALSCSHIGYISYVRFFLLCFLSPVTNKDLYIKYSMRQKSRLTNGDAGDYERLHLLCVIDITTYHLNTGLAVTIRTRRPSNGDKMWYRKMTELF